MRIVGGELRGRPLSAPAGRAVRPTADRVRQTIFDVLAHAYGEPASGARILDLFAGTGALGLEALSRGASFCLFVEQGAEARAAIRANAEALGVLGRTRIWRRDATALGPAGGVAPFTLVFADPPYRQRLGEAALSSAVAGGWLAPGALAVVEEGAGVAFAPVAGLEVLETRRIGDTEVRVLRRPRDEAG